MNSERVGILDSSLSSSSNVINFKKKVSETQTPIYTESDSNIDSDMIIESGTNTLDIEICVTPNKFTLRKNETYKIIKTATPLTIDINGRPVNESATTTTLSHPYVDKQMQVLIDDIASLRGQNYKLLEQNTDLIEQLRDLKSKNRKLSRNREEIINAYARIVQAEREVDLLTMKKILKLQTQFLLDGFVVMVLGFIGMISYYALSFKFFTPILYLALILAGFGWFLTALISMRRSE